MTALERRIRIGDWLMPYDDATTEVVLERNLIDILNATPGDDQDCMNSRCIRAQRNAHVFPHPVFIVSTIATRVYVVDRLDDAGNPAHAVRYQLTDKDRGLINAHDRYGAGEPGELRLRIPSDPKGSPKRAASDPEGRYGGGPRRSGNGKNTRGTRPVTSHSLGAKARFKVAVGSLKKDE
jgi:hypothetical protein